jgi:hypothetical protein
MTRRAVAKRTRRVEEELMGSTLLSTETTSKGAAPQDLIVGTLVLSAAGDWPQARGEWELVAAWPAPGGRCLCGSHIRQRALLRNRLTGHRALFGCCCVKHFPAAAGIFRVLARVMAAPTRPLSPEAAEWAYGHRFLNEWQRDFSLDTWGRPQSPRMRAKRLEVHRELFDLMAAVGGLAAPSDKARADASPADLPSPRVGSPPRTGTNGRRGGSDD